MPANSRYQPCALPKKQYRFGGCVLEIIRSGQGWGGKISSIANNICSQWLKFEQRAPAAVVSMALSQPDEDGFITKGGSKGKVGKKGKKGTKSSNEDETGLPTEEVGGITKGSSKSKGKKGKKGTSKTKSGNEEPEGSQQSGKGPSLSTSDGPGEAAATERPAAAAPPIRGGLVTQPRSAEVEEIVREVCQRVLPEQLAAVLKSLPKEGPPLTDTGAAANNAWATPSHAAPAADAAPAYTQWFDSGDAAASQHPPFQLRMPGSDQAGSMGADGLICPICNKFVRGGRSALNAHQLTSSSCRAARGDSECGREPCQYCGKMLAADDEWARQQHAAFCPQQRRPSGHGPPAAASSWRPQSHPSSWRPQGGPPAASSWRPQGGPPAASSWRPQGGPPGASSWRPKGGPPAAWRSPSTPKGGKSGWYYWSG